MQEWHAATTTRQITHSRISSLLISRHLTRPRVASKYSVWTSSVTESGCGNPKICGRVNSKSATVAYAFGTVGHVQPSVRRMAKHTLKEFQEVSEVFNISLNPRMWSFFKTSILWFASWCSSYSSISLWSSRCIGCILALCLCYTHAAMSVATSFITAAVISKSVIGFMK